MAIELNEDEISKDLPHQQRLRDIIGWQIGDGSEEVMNADRLQPIWARCAQHADASRNSREMKG